MDTLRLCTQCREPLPTTTTDRVCPRCQSDPGRTTPQSGAGGRPVPPTPAEIAQSFPQLEILELLGYGGMGMVYKARQPNLNRIVALKILSPDLSGDPAFAERFAREAQSLAKLNHSNIVGIFDFGRAGSFYYFLMEFVDGDNLHDLIHGKRPDPVEARRIVMEVCHALQYAHDEGVVHRDIKPSNLIIDRKGRVKIADFGLAKLAGTTGETTASPALTTVVMGTPHYMAPEQIETPLTVDHRADLYSLGVVYYELLTGELPLGRFDLPSQKSAALDPRVDNVISRALEKDPRRRYQQATELLTAITTAVSPPQPSARKRAEEKSWSFFRQFALMAGTALVTILCYFVVKDHWPGKKPRPNPPTASVDFTGTTEGPLVGRRIIGALQLTKPKIQEVDRIIRRYQREFIALERKHTEHTKDKAGHIHITVLPFPDEAQNLRNGMWNDLGMVLTPPQLTNAQSLDFDRFFPHSGKDTVRVEIWKDPNGEEHYVESEDPGPNGPSRGLRDSPTTLPPRYRYYLPANK